MESRDIVRGVLEEDGMLLITFRGHDGYFRVPLTDMVLCEQIRNAQDKRQEISFSFDRDLKILSVR